MVGLLIICAEVIQVRGEMIGGFWLKVLIRDVLESIEIKLEVLEVFEKLSM